MSGSSELSANCVSRLILIYWDLAWDLLLWEWIRLRRSIGSRQAADATVKYRWGLVYRVIEELIAPPCPLIGIAYTYPICSDLHKCLRVGGVKGCLFVDSALEDRLKFPTLLTEEFPLEPHPAWPLPQKTHTLSPLSLSFSLCLNSMGFIGMGTIYLHCQSRWNRS